MITSPLPSNVRHRAMITHSGGSKGSLGGPWLSQIFCWPPACLLKLCFLKLSLCMFGAKCHCADCFCQQMIYSTPRVDCFAHSVPHGRSLNTVTFAGNSFYSIRALLLYITVLKL